MFFDGLSDAELERVASLLEERAVVPGSVLVREGDPAEEIFVIRDGAVEVVKLAPGGGEQRLATLRAGQTFGEMTFVDGGPRSATVRAVEATTVALLPMGRLRALAAAEPRIEARMLRNLTADLSRRLRGTSEQTVRALEQELALERTRAAMGKFVTYAIGLMVAYGFLLRFVADMARSVADTSLVSIPVILGFAGTLYAMARLSGEPMSSYGLTLAGWRASLTDSLRWTFPVLVVMTLGKWLLVRGMPAFAVEPVFSFDGALDPQATAATVRLGLVMSLAYIVVVPFQEFAARGALQGPLERFLTGPRSVPLAIVVANLMFVASHLHLSTTFALMAFVPGLLWGWLYSRNRNLIGPIVSHVLIGFVGLYVLGLGHLMTR